MHVAQRISRYAGLIADPTRAFILASLLDGKAKTASELTVGSGASAQSVSGHLAKLLEGGLVRVHPQGRYRYYALYDHTVAEAIEALDLLSPESVRSFSVAAPRDLLLARCCYDHVAGHLGVLIAAQLLKLRWLRAADREYELTRAGAKGLAELGIDVHAARNGRRAFARTCMDWTERKPHIAGALGASLLQLLIERKWVERAKVARMLRITPEGRRGLLLHLGVSV